MSQISPPIRILLVCALAFMGAYMLFLRPKDAAVPPADPAPNVQTGAPAQSGPGKAVEAAQGAVKAADGQLAQQESVDGVDAGESAAGTQPATKASKSGSTPAATAPAGKVDVAGLPKPVGEAIRKGQVLVLLFWNGKSADDKAVHKALAKVDRWDGRVSVQSASIKKISKYGRVARGVDVEQSPTVVVADPQLRAETLVGYVDTETIDQAVVDALRNSTGLFTDAYLKKVDHVCAKYSNVVGPVVAEWVASLDELSNNFAVVSQRYPKFAADFKAIPAPKKWQGFKRATVADNASYAAIFSGVAASLGPHPTARQTLAALDKYGPRARTLTKRYNRRMDGQHLFRCGPQG